MSVICQLKGIYLYILNTEIQHHCPSRSWANILVFCAWKNMNVCSLLFRSESDYTWDTVITIDKRTFTGAEWPKGHRQNLSLPKLTLSCLCTHNKCFNVHGCMWTAHALTHTNTDQSNSCQSSHNIWSLLLFCLHFKTLSKIT